MDLLIDSLGQVSGSRVGVQVLLPEPLTVVEGGFVLVVLDVDAVDVGDFLDSALNEGLEVGKSVALSRQQVELLDEADVVLPQSFRALLHLVYHCVKARAHFPQFLAFLVPNVRQLLLRHLLHLLLVLSPLVFFFWRTSFLVFKQIQELHVYLPYLYR